MSKQENSRVCRVQPEGCLLLNGKIYSHKMPNELTGKHCYGSDSLQITETVFRNQLISTKVFICNCCLVKASNLNRMFAFLSKVCFEFCFVSRSFFIQPMPIVINFPKLIKFHISTYCPKNHAILTFKISLPNGLFRTLRG